MGIAASLALNFLKGVADSTNLKFLLIENDIRKET